MQFVVTRTSLDPFDPDRPPTPDAVARPMSGGDICYWTVELDTLDDLLSFYERHRPPSVNDTYVLEFSAGRLWGDTVGSIDIVDQDFDPD